MKIVLPVHHFLPTYRAGAEQYTAKLARALIARDHDVEVVAIESVAHGAVGELREMREIYDGIKVIRLSFDLEKSPNRDQWLFDNPLLGDWFDRYFRQERPDIVHFQAGYLIGVAPIFAAHANRVPAVYTLHDYWFICPRHTLLRGDDSLCTAVPVDPSGCAWCYALQKRRHQILNRVTLGAFGEQATRTDHFRKRDVLALRRHRLEEAYATLDAVIAPSNFMATSVRAFYPSKRIDVVQIGIQQAMFADVTPAWPVNGLRFGFIGQLSEHKGVHLLIEAFRHLRSTLPLELAIHGNAAVPRYLEQLHHLANGDKRISFHGSFDNARVAGIMASFSACVVPSIWYENAPLVIQEALAAGVPVITAAMGGMQELVADQSTGLHFEPGSVQSLAGAMQHLVDDPALLDRLRQGVAHRTVRTGDDEMRDLYAIYDRVLSHRYVHQP